MENKDGRWKIFHVNSVDVVNSREISEDWTEEKKNKAILFLEAERKDMTRLEFGQEYLGLFADDLRQWFDDDLIMRCMDGRTTPEGQTYLGVDVARMGEDESSFEAVRIDGNKLYHILNKITKKTLLSDTTKLIIELHRVYDFSRIFIDDEGIGVGVLDHLLDNDTTKRVSVGLKNSKRIIDKNKNTSKLQKTLLYTNLRMLMENGQISLLNDPKVFQSLKSVQYEYTSDKKGTPFLKIFGRYTHIAEGLVRAAWGWKEKGLNIWIDSIKV